MSEYTALLDYLHYQFPPTVGHIPLTEKVSALKARTERLEKALEWSLQHIDPDRLSWSREDFNQFNESHYLTIKVEAKAVLEEVRHA